MTGSPRDGAGIGGGGVSLPVRCFEDARYLQVQGLLAWLWSQTPWAHLLPPSPLMPCVTLKK